MLSNNLKSLVDDVPVFVIKFRKTNGQAIKWEGREAYNLFYRAVIDLPHGYVPRSNQRGASFGFVSDGVSRFMKLRRRLKIEQRNETKGRKWWWSDKLIVTGKARFEKTEQGWLGSDDKVYGD